MSALEQVEMAEDEADGGRIVDRLYRALEEGDAEAARACCTPGVVFWHSFDRLPNDIETAVTGWRQLFQGFPTRRFVDVRRAPIPGGVVQQQTLVATTASGVTMAWPVCMVIFTEGGLIRRVEEYIDRAGHYAAEPGATTTPGLEPAASPA